MTDKQTGEAHMVGKQGMARGIFLILCLVIVALFIGLWTKLASKDVKINILEQQSATEQIISVADSKASNHGEWYISLASFRLEKDAVAMLKRITQKGIKADYISFIGSRKSYQWYRVRVVGFANEKAAQEQLIVLANKLGIRNAWVGKEF